MRGLLLRHFLREDGTVRLALPFDFDLRAALEFSAWCACRSSEGCRVREHRVAVHAEVDDRTGPFQTAERAFDHERAFRLVVLDLQHLRGEGLIGHPGAHGVDGLPDGQGGQGLHVAAALHLGRGCRRHHRESACRDDLERQRGRGPADCVQPALHRRRVFLRRLRRGDAVDVNADGVHEVVALLALDLDARTVDQRIEHERNVVVAVKLRVGVAPDLAAADLEREHEVRRRRRLVQQLDNAVDVHRNGDVGVLDEDAGRDDGIHAQCSFDVHTLADDQVGEQLGGVVAVADGRLGGRRDGPPGHDEGAVGLRRRQRFDASLEFDLAASVPRLALNRGRRTRHADEDADDVAGLDGTQGNRGVDARPHEPQLHRARRHALQCEPASRAYQRRDRRADHLRGHRRRRHGGRREADRGRQRRARRLRGLRPCRHVAHDPRALGRAIT